MDSSFPSSPGSVRARSAVVDRNFRADLRAMVPDGLAALLFTAIAYAWLWSRVTAGVSPAAVTMGKSMGTGGLRAYTISQAFGFAAVVWSWGTLLLGLSVATNLWRAHQAWRNIVERLHRTTSLTTISLVVAHAVALLWDKMSSGTPVQLFVPFASHYGPRRFPLALGILALYGALLVGPTFYLRNRLGPRVWRLTHRIFIPAVYVMGVWHTFARGEDLPRYSAPWLALWAMQLPLILAFVLRLARPARRSEDFLRRLSAPHPVSVPVRGRQQRRV